MFSVFMFYNKIMNLTYCIWLILADLQHIMFYLFFGILRVNYLNKEIYMNSLF